jgi:hypothetical protein
VGWERLAWDVCALKVVIPSGEGGAQGGKPRET